MLALTRLGGWLLGVWEQIDREAAEARELERRPGFDARVPGVLILTALILTFQHYLGDRPFFKAQFPDRNGSTYYDLYSFAWWTGAKLVGYFIVPAALVKWVFGGRLRDFGLRTDGILRHLWIYGALFAAILPLVIAVSYSAAFQRTYPFYRFAARSWFDFIAWELMYGASFVALEFFFRGFLLFALKRALGSYAIFVMAVPYCMIHFHKPWPEVCGAIFAGVALGTLAMASRSIWYGVLVHVSVAWSMDLLATVHAYGWPGG